jgi:L-arabinose isomerase
MIIFNRQYRALQEQLIEAETKLKHAEQERGLKLEELEHKFKLKTEEVEHLTKLRSEQEISKMKLDYDKRLDAQDTKHTKEQERLKSKHAQALAQAESTLAKEYYDKTQAALQEINMNGNHNTKFMEKMAMKFMDKPSLPAIMETRNITKNYELSEDE